MTNTQVLIRKAIDILMLAGLIATVVMCVLGYRIGLFTKADALHDFLIQAGVFAPVLFILMQIVQVVVPIIPGGLTCLAGVLVFGPVWGFVYNYIGIVIGSILNFLCARRYGKLFVRSIVPDSAYQKYIGWLDRESTFDKWFAMAIFLPVAPDDYLCMIAGMTKMPLKKFIAIIILCKPCSIIAYSYGLTIASEMIVKLVG